MRQLKISKQITNRDTLSFSKYLLEISQLKGPLTPEEEVVLAQSIKAGDKKAEDEMVLRNLRFVVSVAKQYQGYGTPIGDLVNEGNIGLIKAAKKFDHTLGNKFVSYAVWWVRQSILQYLSENGRSIRLPLNRVTQLNKIKKAQSHLEQTLNREPTVDEIYDKLEGKIKIEDIDEVLTMDKSVSSLDAGSDIDFRGGDEFNLKDVLEDTNADPTDAKVLIDDQKIELNRLINKLPPRHQLIIVKYYGLDRKGERTLEEIAQEIDLTRERVRQIKNTALLYMGKFARLGKLAEEEKKIRKKRK